MIAPFLILVLGCGATAPDTPDDAIRSVQAETEVRALFRMVAERDCPGIQAVMPSAQTKEKCEEFLHTAEEQGLSLVDIDDVVVDGRDPDAFLVKTRVSRTKGEGRVVIRATWSPKGWSIRM